MLEATSKTAIATAPKISASKDPYPKPKLPTLGKMTIVITAKIIPINKYGNLLPILGIQVRSDKDPIPGCTTRPASGGKMKNQPNFVGSAPKVWKILLICEVSKVNAICTPK